MTILVLGAGPSGLAAAHAASQNGQEVALVDENFEPGGQIWRGGPVQWRDQRAHRLWQDLLVRPHLEFIGPARAISLVAPQELLLETASGPRTLRWQRAIICSGARELLLPFPGWTLSRVTGAGGLQALAKGGMPLDGKRVVVAGTGPLLLAVAHTVVKNGGTVVAIVEQRSTAELARFFGQLLLSHRGKVWQAMQLMTALRGIPYLHGATVTEACGEDRVRSVLVSHNGAQRELECDFLACGYGLVPNLEAAALLGCATHAGSVVVDQQQRTSNEHVWAAGESTGIGGVDKALAEGRIAGLCATGQLPTASELRARTKARAFGTLLARSFAPLPALRALCRPSTLVCRCEDVSAAQLAVHANWRSAKLQTRAGMGPCQGRVCGAACEFLFGWEAPGQRVPIYPTTAATLAARAGTTTTEEKQ
ncbi:MAG: FAD-dependent oxidoreductase [Pseudomonadota bacterium]